jgi:hypothetical protein
MSEYGNTESNYFQPTEPKEQKEERIELESKARAGLKLMEDIIEHFEKRIAFYNTLDALTDDVDIDAEVHLRQVIANKQTVKNLTEEMEYLIGLKQSVER